jgi:hypothetical protein
MSDSTAGSNPPTRRYEAQALLKRATSAAETHCTRSGQSRRPAAQRHPLQRPSQPSATSDDVQSGGTSSSRRV